MKKRNCLVLCLSILLVGCVNKPNPSSVISNESSQVNSNSSNYDSSQKVPSSSNLEISSQISESINSSSSESISTNSSETTSSITSESISSSDYDFSTTSSSSSITSFESESSSSSSSNTQILKSISACKEKAVELLPLVNDKNVAESDIQVEIEAKLLARFDAITTKSGYGDRYKLLVANEDGYIYLKVNGDIYSRLENKIGSFFNIKGNLSLYCGEVEITVSEMLTEVSHESNNYENLYVEKSLEQIYRNLDLVSLNTKGCGYSSLVKFTGKYLATMDDVVLLFSDGSKIIQVHGPKKFKNSLSVGQVYDIYGAMNMYNYRPGVEYVFSKINNQVSISNYDKNSLDTISNSIYSIKYEVDKNKIYPSYSSMFEELKVYRGYANFYQKGSNYYVVLTDQYKNESYYAYTNARDDKAIFIKNESCVGLTDFTFCPFEEYILENIYIELVVAPYLWNNLKYWQVFAIEDSITVIDNI